MSAAGLIYSGTMKTHRLFYAIALEEKMKSYLGRYRDDISALTRGRPVPDEMLHITLHFIGNVKTDEIEKFIEILNASAESMRPFTAKAGGFGSFRQRKGSLIYARVEIDNETISAVNALKKRTGTGDMKQFKPHITLLRNVQASRELQEKAFRKASLDISAEINNVCLMESEFNGGRPHYSILHSAPLTPRF